MLVLGVLVLGSLVPIVLAKSLQYLIAGFVCTVSWPVLGRAEKSLNVEAVLALWWLTPM